MFEYIMDCTIKNVFMILKLSSVIYNTKCIQAFQIAQSKMVFIMGSFNILPSHGVHV